MNKTYIRTSNKSAGIRVKSTVKAGGFGSNHSAGIRVKSTVKAGGFGSNHNVNLISAG